MIERLMGLDVADNDGYQAYREAMSPLLERIGGGFRYDFTIAKTLRNSAGHEINRVFITTFRIGRRETASSTMKPIGRPGGGSSRPQ